MVTCESCGTTFSATSPRARFCSDRCRKRVARSRGSRRLTAVPPVAPAVDGALVLAVRKQLGDAGRLDSWEAAAALDMARRIEAAIGAPLSQASAAHRELRASVAAAVKGATRRKSKLQKHRDELADRRARRGGASHED